MPWNASGKSTGQRGHDIKTEARGDPRQFVVEALEGADRVQDGAAPGRVVGPEHGLVEGRELVFLPTLSNEDVQATIAQCLVLSQNGGSIALWQRKVNPMSKVNWQPSVGMACRPILGVSEDEVVSMNRRLSAPDSSLNAPLREESDAEWQDMLVDDNVTQEAQLAEESEMGLRKELLVEAMQGLNEREQHILTERRLKDSPSTLEDLSQVYDISRERVRQIEARAFEKLQKAMKNAMRERMLDSEAAREEFNG